MYHNSKQRYVFVYLPNAHALFNATLSKKGIENLYNSTKVSSDFNFSEKL